MLISIHLKIGSVSTRRAHTDVKIPNFDEYRNTFTENPNESSKVHADDKQTYSYISTFGEKNINNKLTHQ